MVVLTRVIGRVAVLAVVTAIVVLLMSDPGAAGLLRPSGSPSAPDARRPVAPTPAPSSMAMGELDGPGYDPQVTTEPTGGKPQSKLWHHDGSWWGILHRSDGVAAIFRLDWASQSWQDTGTVVDPRPSARADALIDGNQLYVLSAGWNDNPSQAAWLLRYTYDPEARLFSPDADFPVQLTPAGVHSLTIARDSVGRLWAALVVGGELLVSHSTDSDHRWVEPAPIGVGADVREVEEAAIFAFDGQIGVIWTGANQDTVVVARRHDSAPLETWDETRTVVDGLALADDHLNVKVARVDGATRVFVVIKTSLNDLRNPNPRHPQVLLLEMLGDGTWRQHLVGRVENNHTRPVLAIDEERGRIFVVATARDGIYLKESALDPIAFADGLGTPMIIGGGRPNDATTTKQNVGSKTGLVVASSDDVTGTYRTAVLDLGGTPIPGVPASSVQPATRAERLAMAHDFDPLSSGSVPVGWRGASEADAVTAQVAEVADGGIALVVRSEDHAHRYCGSFATESSGVVELVADVMVGPEFGGGASLGSLRGTGADTGSVRMASAGRVVYETAGRRVETGVFLAPDAWYRVSISADIEAGTYAWSIARRGTETPLLAIDGLAWQVVGPTLSRACFATPDARASLSIDSIRVTVEH